MKFSAREDIGAPIDAVWAAVTDFPDFERKAAHKGAGVRRLAEGEVGLGSGWMTTFHYHGVARDLECVLTGFEPPHRLEADSHSGGIDGFLTVELVALSQAATQLFLSLELRPVTLPGRMLIQTLKLARGPLAKRFEGSVERFAKGIELASV